MLPVPVFRRKVIRVITWSKKAKKKKKAYKLALGVVGVVGSVTMSALGLGMFSGPFQGLM